MQLKVGMRLRSTAFDTEAIIVRAPDKDLDITCRGRPMVVKDDTSTPRQKLVPELAGGSQLGQRYAVEDFDLELLATKAGQRTLCVDGEPLTLKEAKALPSGD